MAFRGEGTWKQCKATAKNTGERCQNPAVKGWDVCRHHGAGNRKAPKRDGSPAVPGGRPPIHNRYAEFFNADDQERLEKVTIDERLLELSDEIELGRERVAARREFVNVGESLEAVKRRKALVEEAQEVKDELDYTIRNPEIENRQERFAQADARLSEVLSEIHMIENSLMSQFMAMAEQRKEEDHVRKLTQSDASRRKDLYDVIYREQAYGIVAQIQTIVLNRISEFFGDDARVRQYRSAIAGDLRRLASMEMEDANGQQGSNDGE